MKVARLPNRPSDLIGMPTAGCDPWTCLDFDFGCVSFDEEWTRYRSETDTVPLTKAEREAKPTKQVPRHDEEALRRFLGLSTEAPVDYAEVDRLVNAALTGDLGWLDEALVPPVDDEGSPPWM